MKSLAAPSRLIEETEHYLRAGQFNRFAQVKFAQIFRGSFGSAPLADRMKVSQTVCELRTVPVDVVLLICCDVDAVSVPVLRHSPMLSGSELTMQIMQGTRAKREAIAQRSDLTMSLISQLLMFGEQAVARHLAANEQIQSCISSPMRSKICRIGALEIEQLEPKTMSEENDKLDALVSSMEQDWCAHYKPEALGQVAQEETSPQEQPNKLDMSMTGSELTEEQSNAEGNEAPMPSDDLLLTSEDMKILDQLSESDWDALDDEAIEALAKQLAQEDASSFDETPSMVSEDETVYGMEPSDLPSQELASDQDTQAATDDLVDDLEMLEPLAESPLAEVLPAQDPSDEIEQGVVPFSFSIGVYDSENADFPPLTKALAPGEREATVAFGTEQTSQSAQNEALLSTATPDTRGSFVAQDPLEDDLEEIEREVVATHRTSFVISADEPPLTELLAPTFDDTATPEPEASEPNAPIAQQKLPEARKQQSSYRTSTLEDLQSALKRPLDQQEAELLQQTLGKVSNGLVGEDSSTPKEPAQHSERKPQITLTIRKSSSSASSRATDLQTPPAPVAIEDKKDIAESAPAPDTSKRIPETTVPRAHLTSATEADWERALARLTGDVPAENGTNEPSRVFSVPQANVDTERTDPSLTVRPMKDLGKSGRDETIQKIENELEIDDFLKEKEPELQPRADVISTSAEAEQEAQAQQLPSPALSNPDVILAAEPLPIPRGAPSALSDESHLEEETLVEEHAPMGFMPDTISFAGLDLVEAEPDLPSVSDLLLRQSGAATPHVELIEPIEIDILENGKLTSLDELAATPMQVVSEQLEAQRDALNALRQKMKDYEDGSKQSNTADVLSQIQSIEARFQADFKSNEDISSLPEFSGHKVVAVEDYQTLKAQDPQQLSQRDPAAPPLASAQEDDAIALASSVLHATNRDGFASRFYAYDAETRLTILQSILAETIVEAAQQIETDKDRPMLDDARVSELVAARFSNDRIRAADLMHDISGHRRLDMTQLLQDKGGEALVVYLYSIGVDESSTLSILLHGPDAISHDYEKITQLMTLYNQLYPAAAHKIVTQLFGVPRSLSSLQHMPMQDEGAGYKSARSRTTGLNTTSNQAGSEAPEFGRRLKRPDNS